MTKFALEGYGITFEKIFRWGGKVTIELGGRAHLLGVAMMKKGTANAISGSDYYPSTWISECGKEKGINLLSMDEEVADKVCQRYGLVKCVIPKNAYPFLKSDVLSFKDMDIVATKTNVPEELVYDFTKTICESADRVRLFRRTDSLIPKRPGRISAPFIPEPRNTIEKWVIFRASFQQSLETRLQISQIFCNLL